MGTCYYLYERGDLLERLAQGEPSVRLIGKSSGGWCFSLRVYPGENINSLEDWYRLWRKNNNVIKDEYGYEVTIEEMLDVITNRSRKFVPFVPSKNYSSEQDMLDKNSAEKGPNNLLRGRINRHCIGHGPGTWDLIAEDFS